MDGRSALRSVRSDPLARTRDGFALALLASDPREARGIIRALPADASPARAYVEVMRPGLASVLADTRRASASVHHRLALAIVGSIAAELAAEGPEGQGGDGRRALVRHGEGALAALDARVLADALEAEGWAVDVGPLADGADPGAAFVALTGVSAADLLAAPPVARADQARVLCPMGPERSAGTSPAGVDAVVGLDALLALVGAHAAPNAEGRWGVRLQRFAGGLLVAPAGRLDATNAERLREVVDSRRGSFSFLLVDLRDATALEPEGLALLGRWRARTQADGVEMAVLAPPAARGALLAAGLLDEPRLGEWA